MQVLSAGGAKIVGVLEGTRVAQHLGRLGVDANGKSLVNTFSRDYVSRMDLAHAKTVMAQMAAGFEHFNEAQPHSALKMKSPREFRQHPAAEQRRAQIEQTQHCE